MKVNEAPEKLYFGESDKGILDIYSTKESDDEIEYICTDVFIEKVARFLEYKLNDRVEIRVAGTLIPSLTDKKTFIEDVKEYMKGEQE